MTEPLSLVRLRLLRVLAAGAWLFTTIAVLASLLLWFIRGLPPLPLSFLHGPGANLSAALLGFTYGTVGAILASRRPTNFIGWLFLVTGVLLGLVIPLNLLVLDSVHTFRPISPVVLWLAWGVSSFDAPLAAGTAFIVAVIFPGDRSPGLWQRLVLVQFVAFVLIGVGSALDPSGLVWFPTLPNPLQLPAALDPAFRALMLGALALAVFGMVAGAISLPIRYRQADPHLRLQLRWIMAAIALLPFTTAPLFIARYGMGAPNEVGEILMVVAGVGGCAFPVAVAIAIMRHHLFGIERLVERALVFVPLTAILAGLYAASVALFQRLFMALTGSTSEASVVLSTLILASTFTPIRQALERMVDRRFNPKHAQNAAMVHARVVGEPSLVPAGSMILDMPAAPGTARATADAGRAGASPPAARREAAVRPTVGVDEVDTVREEARAAGSELRGVVEDVHGTEAVVAALERLGDRLASIEGRIARLEDERAADEIFGPAPRRHPEVAHAGDVAPAPAGPELPAGTEIPTTVPDPPSAPTGQPQATRVASARVAGS